MDMQTSNLFQSGLTLDSPAGPPETQQPQMPTPVVQRLLSSETGDMDAGVEPDRLCQRDDDPTILSDRTQSDHEESQGTWRSHNCNSVGNTSSSEHPVSSQGSMKPVAEPQVENTAEEVPDQKQ